MKQFSLWFQIPLLFSAAINNYSMKKIFLVGLMAIAILGADMASVMAQSVQVTNGPDLNSDKNNNMNRTMDGDENSFYCYRVRSRGKGTSFYVEKYDKKTMKQEFQKEVDLGESRTYLEDVFYSNDNVYVFSRQYDKEGDKMSLYCQTISSKGVVDLTKTMITSVKSDHYEFVEFTIAQNPKKTKFIVKSSHKPDKEGKYVTDFILLTSPGLKADWTKTIDGQYFVNEPVTNAIFFTFKNGVSNHLLSLMIDNADNVYYAYTTRAHPENKKDESENFMVGKFNASSSTPQILNLKFDDNYYISDVEFKQNKANEIVIGGFLKDVVERKGRDLVKCGIFSFTINTDSYTITANPVKFFDDKMLKALEAKPKHLRSFRFKMDYILPSGNEVFYVGEIYRRIVVERRSGMMVTYTYNYEYMDVIVAKLNASGQFEWITNAPLRNNIGNLPVPHVFKQYFATITDKNIFIFNNDHPKNMERYVKADFEPEDLKTVTGIHGSSFVFSSVSMATGKISHKLIFENDTYCFAPIQERNPQFWPPEKAEIFVPGGKNEVFVYTEDRGKDRFVKLNIKD